VAVFGHGGGFPLGLPETPFGKRYALSAAAPA
jgi:hypothetical protein